MRGLRQDPSIGTHMFPLSAIAIGGIILYCGGVLSPLQAIENMEIPYESRPASWPKELHPITTPSARAMQDRALIASAPV